MHFVCAILVVTIVKIDCGKDVEKAWISNDVCKIEIAPGKTCYNTELVDDIPYLEERTSAFPEDTIFFIETSCRGGLDLRQACAVEAAARAHPGRTVAVLFAAPLTTRCLTSSPSWEILKYVNVHLYRLQLPVFFQNTPLESLMTTERRCEVNRLTDILRFLTLYKFGGVYLALDVMVTKSLDLLPDKHNFAGRIDADIVGADLLALAKHGIGRLIVHAVLMEFLDKFKTKKPWQRSSAVLTKVLRNICTINDVRQMSASTCEGFAIYDSFYFYPIHYKTWKNIFAYSNGDISTESYAFHLWNRYSRNETIYEDTLYAQLINAHCPRIKNITN